MPNVHVWLRSYGTTHQTGGSLVAYLRREGMFAPVRYLQRDGTRYERYDDFTEGGVAHLPAWAHGDAEHFFAAAMQCERANGYYAFQAQFSLPRELSYAQQMALAEDVRAALMPDLPHLWVRHDKRLPDGTMHPHLHVLFSSRRQDGIARVEAQTFQRWNRAHPEHGGCQKDLLWSKRQAPELLRYALADLTNMHLEQAGVDTRVDFRSLRVRGMERQAHRRTHPVPRTAQTQAQEHAQAVQAWEQRKAFLGMGPAQELSRAQMVACVQQRIRQTPQGQAITPHATVADQAAAVARREDAMEVNRQRLERYAKALRGEARAHEVVDLLQPAPVRQGLTVHLDEGERWGMSHG